MCHLLLNFPPLRVNIFCLKFGFVTMENMRSYRKRIYRNQFIWVHKTMELWGNRHTFFFDLPSLYYYLDLGSATSSTGFNWISVFRHPEGELNSRIVLLVSIFVGTDFPITFTKVVHDNGTYCLTCFPRHWGEIPHILCCYLKQILWEEPKNNFSQTRESNLIDAYANR